MNKLWNDKNYYKRISEKETFDHPGFLLAKKYCLNTKKILDMGCGDGSKLIRLGNSKTERFGCDVSNISQKLGFVKFDGVKLPFESNFFDRVVSFFVLEHTQKPKELLVEMVRVLEPEGLLILLCPNFGAPNRASPNFKGSRIKKLFFNPRWNKVAAKTESMENFQSDFDTIMEPYLGDVVAFLKQRGLKIIETNSFWEMELKNAKVWQKLFKYFFKNWGPHLFLVAQKS